MMCVKSVCELTWTSSIYHDSYLSDTEGEYLCMALKKNTVCAEVDFIREIFFNTPPLEFWSSFFCSSLSISPIFYLLEEWSTILSMSWLSMSDMSYQSSLANSVSQTWAVSRFMVFPMILRRYKSFLRVTFLLYVKWPLGGLLATYHHVNWS